MKRVLILVALLSACTLSMPKLPTPAEICALSPEDRATLIATLGTDAANLALACTLTK
jgi:hypothetical protein